MMSSPPRPSIVSSPPPPQMTSLPWLPTRLSDPDVPSIVHSPEGPVGDVAPPGGGRGSDRSSRSASRPAGQVPVSFQPMLALTDGSSSQNRSSSSSSTQNVNWV